MRTTSTPRRLAAIVVASVGLVLPLAVTAAPPAVAADRTSTTEARRIDERLDEAARMRRHAA